MDYEDEEAQEWLSGPKTSAPGVRQQNENIPESVKHEDKNRTGSRRLIDQSVTLPRTSKKAESPQKTSSVPKSTFEWNPITRTHTKPASRVQETVNMSIHEKGAFPQSFSRLLLDLSVITSIGTFKWPGTDEMTAQRCLGLNLELLESIRNDHSCWIVPENQPCTTIKIYGELPRHVKNALARVRAVFRQIEAQTMRGSVVRLTKPMRKSTYDAEVFVTPDDIVLAPDSRKIYVNINVSTPQNAPPALEEGAQSILENNLTRMRTTLRDVASRLSFYRGHLTMKVRYGAMVYTKYRDSITTVEDLKSMLEDPQCQFQVEPQTSRSTVSGNLPRKFSQSSDLQLLGEVGGDFNMPKPTYGVEFIMNSNIVGAKGTLVLYLECQTNWAGEFDRTVTRWSALRESGERHKLLDIDIINIERRVNYALCLDCSTNYEPRSMSWHIGLAGERVFDSARYPPLLDFSDSVTMQHADTLAGGAHAFKTCYNQPKPALLRITSFRQSVNYKYHIRQSNIICELTHENSPRHQDSDRQQIALDWSINLSCVDWEARLSKNADLGLGEEISSSDSIAAVFGGSNDGLDKLLESMRIVEEIVHSADAALI